MARQQKLGVDGSFLWLGWKGATPALGSDVGLAISLQAAFFANENISLRLKTG